MDSGMKYRICLDKKSFIQARTLEHPTSKNKLNAFYIYESFKNERVKISFSINGLTFQLRLNLIRADSSWLMMSYERIGRKQFVIIFYLQEYFPIIILVLHSFG